MCLLSSTPKIGILCCTSNASSLSKLQVLSHWIPWQKWRNKFNKTAIDIIFSTHGAFLYSIYISLLVFKIIQDLTKCRRSFALFCFWLTLYDGYSVKPRNLKGGIGFLFDPCVNAMWQPRMKVSYCTFGFGTIIRRDPRTSLLRDSLCDNQYACVIWVHAGKASHANNEIIFMVGLATKKSGDTVTHLHMRRQDGRHNKFPPTNFHAWNRILLGLRLHIGSH